MGPRTSTSGGKTMNRIALWVVSAGCGLATMGLGATATHAQDLGPYPTTYGDRPSPLSFYSEIEILDGSYFISEQFDFAFNGDLSRSGFILRGTVGSGDDDYITTDATGARQKIDVDPVTADLLLGYTLVGGNLRWTTLVGGNYLDYDINPSDPSNPTAGDEAGFKVASSLETEEAKPVYAGIYGEYSTAYNTYYAIARLGYRFSNTVIGPEFVALGDETFDSQRVGGFINFPLRLLANLQPDVTIAGGYSFVGDDDGIGFSPGAGGGDGGYLTVGFGLDF